MSKTAEIERARLRQQVFLYLAACIRRNEFNAIRSLSVRPEQVRRIANLRANDLVALGELSGPSIQFDIDPVALDAVFLALEAKQARERLIERCLQRDAPRAMMQRYFGLSRQRYAKRKHELGMKEQRGRARQPTESIRDAIHCLWEASQKPRTAATLLDVAVQLEISLRTVWDQLADQLD